MHPLMYDRGRGPELCRTRITVYDLIPYFEKGTFSDEFLCDLFRISREELDALRQYIADHRDEVMAENARIDERHRRGMEAQNTPEFRARSEESRRRLLAFRDWLSARKARGEPMTAEGADLIGEFRVWYEAQRNGAGHGGQP